MKWFLAVAAIATAGLVGYGSWASQSDPGKSGAAASSETRTANMAGVTMRPHRAPALVALAVASAEKRWGGTRCEGIELLYRRLGTDLIAEAEWDPSELDPTVYQHCSITFDTSLISFPHYCATLVHEYGHLAGFREEGGPDLGLHSRNRQNLMYPVISDSNVPRACKAAAR
jgi:hypothetical protein